MHEIRIITAIGTPLKENEELHEEGLDIHLADQWTAGISGIFVGGTMGVLQLLRDTTYEQLVRFAVERSAGKGEVFAGAGDTSFGRTRDRIEFLNRFALDGTVVLPPYFFTFTQEELVDYYRSLADVSRAPLYLYDHPGLTRTKLQLDTVATLAEHPNIRGIKVSDEPGFTRQLYDRCGDRFRIIFAQPDLVDVFIHHGVRDHLDGIYALAPRWVTALVECAQREQWVEAAAHQRRITHLRRLLLKHGAFSAFTVMMNARGIPGNFAPRPWRTLVEDQRQLLLDDPVMKELILCQPT